MEATELTGPPGPWEPSDLAPPPVGAAEGHADPLSDPADLTDPSDSLDPLDPSGDLYATQWPWDTLHSEQEAREGSFTDALRREYRWDEEAFSRLESAMRAACQALDGRTTIDRWVGEGFWCWTAVVPELTEHPRFVTPDPQYLRRCLARLRDLGSWFFNGTSPFGPDHEWEPVPRTRP